MRSFTAIAWSSVGKKIFTGITGLCLCGFVLVHLAGNMTLLDSSGETFNLYAHHLTSLGPILIVVEVILVTIFLIHIIIGLTIFISKLQGRPVAYEVVTNAGGASHKTISSTTMIYTGALMLTFMVVHLINFKYGPYYSTFIDGKEVRDLYRLVLETFAKEGYIIYYVASMLFLGYHLRHGFWSAFQSLGISHPVWTKPVYTIGVLFAILLGVGFVFLPVWLYVKAHYPGGLL
jgi:succinate dehydrogenase / fumarate reductase cytochrome b subunit